MPENPRKLNRAYRIRILFLVILTLFNKFLSSNLVSGSAYPGRDANKWYWQRGSDIIKKLTYTYFIYVSGRSGDTTEVSWQ